MSANMGPFALVAHQGDRTRPVSQAAQLKGDTLEVKAQLLRELLTESNAFGYLIGSGAPGKGGGQLQQAPCLAWPVQVYGSAFSAACMCVTVC